MRTRSADAAAAGCADDGPGSGNDVEVGTGDRIIVQGTGARRRWPFTSPIRPAVRTPIAIAQSLARDIQIADEPNRFHNEF